MKKLFCKRETKKNNCKALSEKYLFHGTSTISRTLLLNNFKRNFLNLNDLFLPIFDRQRSHYQMFWSTVISFSQKDFFFHVYSIFGPKILMVKTFDNEIFTYQKYVGRNWWFLITQKSFLETFSSKKIKTDITGPNVRAWHFWPKEG